MKLHAVLAAATLLGGLGVAPAFAQATDKPVDPANSATPDAEKAKPAKHDSGFYLGGGINLYFVQKEAAARGLPIRFIDQPSPATFSARAGYAFNKYIALEGEAGIGGAKQNYGSDGVSDGKIGVKHEESAHVVVTLPTESGVYLQGRAGYTSVTVTREYGISNPGDVKVNGPSVGLGIGLRSGSLDYQMSYTYISANKANSSALGLTIMKHF